MSSMESASAFDSRLVLSRGALWRTASRRLDAYSGWVLAKLRDVAPYVAIVVLPGGSLMALLWWLYRRQKKWRLLSQS
jgi:hypothetical protein